MAKTWHVTFNLTVADCWIEDGFELYAEYVKEAIQGSILDYADDHEKIVSNITVTERPSKAPKRKKPQP
jgi:hypothetical protein